MSKRVTVGTILASGIAFAMAGCSEDEWSTTQAAYSEICVQVGPGGQQVTRVSDDNCTSDNDRCSTYIYPGHYYWYYLGRSQQAPPVGAHLPIASGQFSRPASGTIARPPASGGFGTTRVSVGG